MMRQVMLLVLVATLGCGARNKEATVERKLPTVIDSQEFAATVVGAHIETEISVRRNIVYCATTQVAWNLFRDKYTKAPIELEGAPPTALALNEHYDRANDVPAEKSIALAGAMSDGIVAEIQKEAREKFGVEALLPSLTDDDSLIVCFSMLVSELEFPREFKQVTTPSHFGSHNDRIVFFGTDKNADLAHLVEVHDYRGPDDFVIELRSKSKDRLLIAKIDPQKTLLETSKSVLKRTTTLTNTIKEQEPFAMPIVEIGVRHRFTELDGRKVLNHPAVGGSVFWQQLQFRLDQTGASLKSESMKDDKSDKKPPDQPRSFIVDKPFLVMLQADKAEMPYFAMWVDNPEVLRKR